MVKRFSITLMLLFALVACDNKPHPLIVASNTWIGYEPLYIANQFNILAPDFMHITRYPNATQVMEQFARGQLDVAALTLDEAILLLEKGVQFRILTIMDISNGADQVVIKPEVKSIKGINIGVEDTALGALMLHSFLKKFGLNKQDVTILSATVDQHLALYEQGQIDAAVSFPPYSSSLTNAGAEKIYDSSEMLSEKVIDILIVSEQAYTNKLEQLKTLSSAIIQASQLLSKGEPHVLEFSGTNLGEPSYNWSTLTQGVLLADKSLNTTYIQRYKLESIMITLDQLMLENGLLKNSVRDKINLSLFARL